MDEFLKLTDLYVVEGRVFVRNSMNTGFRQLLDVAGLNMTLPQDDIQQLVSSLGRAIIHPPIEEDYDHWQAVNESVHRTMMVMEEFESTDIIHHVVDEVVQFFDAYRTNWYDAQHYQWLLTGSPWQQGMGSYAMANGPTGEWLVQLLKQNLDRVNEAIANGEPYGNLSTIQTDLMNAIAAYEGANGVVPYPASPPVADTMPDYILIDDDGDGFADAILGGGLSFDPDGTLLDVAWETNGFYTARGLQQVAALPVGTNDVVLRVTDSQALFSESTIRITVVSGFDPTKPIKVFILAGQSNMEGKGWVEHLSPLLDDPATRGPFEHIRDEFNQWRTHGDVWLHWENESLWGDLGPGYGSPHSLPGYTPTRIGPEFQFGHAMRHLLDQQVLIIKTAWGGQSLAADFLPPSAGGPGPAFTMMTNDIADVLNNLTNFFPSYNGQTTEMAGFVWFQGYNDFINASNTAVYTSNLVDFVGDVRSLYGADLPFVVGELGHDGYTAPASVNNFRTQQMNAVTAVSNAIRYAPTAPWWPQEAEDLLDSDPTIWMPGNPNRDDFYAIAADLPFHYMGSGEAMFRFGESFARETAHLLGAPTALIDSNVLFQASGSGPGFIQATVDGSASSDPDGTIVSYVWRVDGVPVASGPTPVFDLTEGVHWLSLTVLDDVGLCGRAFLVVDASNLINPFPDTPTNFVATAGDGQVQLTWDPNAESDLAGYNLYRSTQLIGPFTLVGNQHATNSYLDSPLQNGDRYWYIVSAVDTDGNESALSPAIEATPTAPSSTLYRAAVRAMWNFDEFHVMDHPGGLGLPNGIGGTEGQFPDISGGGHTAYGSAHATANLPHDPFGGKFGGALYSESPQGNSNGGAAVVPHHEDINFNQEDFTYVFWEKVLYRDGDNDFGPGGGRSVLIFKAPNMSGQPGIEGYGLNFNQNTFRLVANNSDNFGQTVQAGVLHGSWDSNRWAHVALVGTYNPGGDNFTLQTYIDGVHLPGLDVTLANDVIDNPGFLTMANFWRNNGYSPQRTLSWNMHSPTGTLGQGWID
ncbi:MAG: sialate O-acetylesterase, partial [Verrucomicrobiota bacterium]